MKSKETKHVTKAEDLLSTGSTLLNLAMTGRIRGGIAKSDYVLVVGDSQAGKTWIGLTALAEAANNKHFDNYELIYDNVENGAKMELERFFGSKMAKRIRPPAGTRDEPVYSETVQELYYNLDDALSAKKPCIYVLDSMDALDAEEDIEQFDKEKRAHRKGKETTGSYGMAKAKANSGKIRSIPRKLRKTRSIVVFIAQTRDKVGGLIPNQKTRGGGRAMKFYAHIECWLSIKKDIEKDIKIGSKKSREQQGIIARIKVEKSRHTGREKKVDVPIYWSFGIDDVGSCVDFLIERGHWSKKGSNIHAEDFGLSTTKSKLIRKIEKRGMERELQMLVLKVWKSIDEQLSIHRKSKYE